MHSSYHKPASTVYKLIINAFLFEIEPITKEIQPVYLTDNEWKVEHFYTRIHPIQGSRTTQVRNLLLRCNDE